MGRRRSVPERTSDWRARKNPRARVSSGTQALVVRSPAPMSSARARRMASMISECIQLGQLGLIFREFGADGIDDFRRSFAEEDIVGELAFRVGDILFQLFALLRNAALLGFGHARGDVDGEIEGGGGADGAGPGNL